ncbi:glutamine-hydrolyzing carbamoyl-phosphate synthase small subunit [Membranicola marinus]|uniref:Carbamoyl phosphate synthase small chain n=1 Tax=Membranihabitans marinus TaxID=1227546 RepID=A0A953HQD9_9BACT|nr:glutamine-hydrolyzing carbamoyl-phosphate synthase small subunit [Membranihabitans marinus]MBY5959329.1 glutamine-hydrolyzing carbamoyl-phosphate synthase small subunit [Membranihabitans marinus]
MKHDTAPDKGYLVLADGTVYTGHAIGVKGTTTGEICFNTGMTGYQETFTDPSYFGQILVSTNVHVGNYGCKDSEQESDGVKIAGFVCRNFSDHYSRKQGDQSLQAYFEDNKVVGISNIDTRALVRKIRTEGAMNAIISSEILDVEELKRQVKEVPSMDGLELASKVGNADEYEVGDPESDLRIAVVDYGVKSSIIENFAVRGALVRVFPASAVYDDIVNWNPDGIFISNGPGDPAAMDYGIEMARQVIEDDRPSFGICLGHQLFALASGIPTYKMHHGHRGANHPVLNTDNGLGEITTQNHGFGVSAEAINDNLDKVEVTHRNLNDQTIEGLRIKGRNAFSVQYHPEASAGPHDARYLFDQFISEVKKYKKESA